MSAPRRDRTRPRWPLAVLVISALLLVSYGGAILAAPITLPLLYLSLRRNVTGWVRLGVVVVAALTAGEMAWAGTYVTLGEAGPWIWLVPMAAVIATGVTFGRAGRRDPV